jgi:flagella synthesis protein FlgN
MSAVAQRLQGASRSAFDNCWSALEAAVQECKALNTRNCRLLMDQHDIMQRVLQTESDTYAPA